MHSFQRALRTISIVTLFFFISSFIPVFQLAAYGADTRKSSGMRSEGATRSTEPRPQTTGDRFEKAVDSIRENVSRAGDKAEKGEDDTSERETIKAKKTDLDSADGEFRKEFSETEKKLKDAKLPKEILDRHYKFVKHYEDNLKELKANLDDIEKATSKSDRRAKLAKARLHLEKTKKPSKHQKLDPNNLPHRAVKAKERAPRLKKEDFEKDFPPQKSSNSHQLAVIQQLHASAFQNPHYAMKNKPILLASNGPASDMPFQLPRPLGERTEVRGGLNPVATVESDLLQQIAFADSAPMLLAQATNVPTSADLAETPEVQFTRDIKDLAANLGNNSLRIFEAVRNNFRYEPYYGSLKGAQQTLREKAGNDFDLASLLVSIYRAAGIPARYVIATITMPISQAQSWLGLEDPKMVGRLLSSAGVPVTVNYTTGNIYIEHVLVQAWVPFQNGRGSLNGTGDSWVYVDPSFKESKITQILNQAIPSFDQMQYLSQLRNEDPVQYYSGLIQENLNVSAPDRTVYAVARHSEIVPLSFGMLLGMPQYDIVTLGGHFQEIPDKYRYKVDFELIDPASLGTSLVYQASTATLAGKRVTLSYSPATTNDQIIISRYGDIYSTPAYLVSLMPELRIEGNTIAQGVPIGSGSTRSFTMRFTSPAAYAEQVVNDAVAGAYYAIVFDLQTVTQDMVFERTQKLEAMNAIVNAGATASLDDHAGELLYATALTYFQKLDAANRKVQELLKIYDLRGVSEAIFSIGVQTAYLFGVPRSIDVSGVHIDVDRDMHLPLPVDGNTGKLKEYHLLIGSNSSYFEHKVIEDVYPTVAISAVKGLQLANAQGIEIYTINNDNINTIIPLLQINSAVKADIANAVNAGKEVIVPQQEISLNSWMGVGYIAMNSLTGEAGYMISGGLAGGDSTDPISLTTYIKASALSGNAALDKEMAAIEASLDLEYDVFPGADNGFGTNDDVWLYKAKYNVFDFVNGPPNTQCAGQLYTNYYNPDPDYGAPLRVINAEQLNYNVTRYLKLSDMLVSSGSGSYARISVGFASVLDHYMRLLNDKKMTPTPSTNSVYRTWYHNCELRKNGCEVNHSCAKEKSNHMAGIAADVGVGVANKQLAKDIALILFDNIGGVGYKHYNTFVHVDIGKARTW